MSERDGYEEGVPCWVDTVQPDPEAAAEFYGELFGWELEDKMPDEAPGHYFFAQAGGREVAAIGSVPPGAPERAAWNTYVWVESADEAADKVKAAGGSVLTEPFDVFESGRMAVLADPGGAVISLWQPNKHKGAQRVNEPGAWSMSQLLTRDPEKAKSFYGEVFGWTTESFAMDGAEMTLFRVPGYEGGEPEQPVSREVIAAMAPMDGVPDEVPSNWAVDFWIDDAERAAEAAEKLGGQVVQQPQEAPPFKRAVLADPGGATFSVSQLMLTD